LAGVVDFEDRLLAGYRYQSDSSSSAAVTTLLFQEYKSFGGPLVATKVISRTGGRTQTITFTSVDYGPLEDCASSAKKRSPWGRATGYRNAIVLTPEMSNGRRQRGFLHDALSSSSTM